MALIGSITADFTSLPATFTTAGGVTAASGRGRFLPTITAGNYDPPATLTGNTTYDLTGSGLIIQVPTAPPLASVEHWFAIRLQQSAGNFADFFIYCDASSRTLQARRSVTATTTTVASVAYSAANHLWLNIRNTTGTTIEWRVSADGTTWTSLGTWSATWAITAVTPIFEMSGERTPTAATEIDNLNLPPTSGPPSAPSGATAVAPSTTQVNVSWQAGSGAATYNLERSSTSASTGFASVQTGISTTTYSDTGRTASTQYWYRVASVSTGGTSGYSNVATVTTPATNAGGSGLPNKISAVYCEYYSGYRIIDCPVNYNVINVFQMEPVGGAPGSTGAMTYPGNTAQLAGDIVTCRARGQKVMITIGGANAQVRLDTTARVTAFVNSIIAFSNALGGNATTAAFDGLDLNNFEGAQDLYTANWISACTQLKTKYGAGFSFSAPPAATHYQNQADRDAPHLVGLYQAGVMDFVAPQYYDGPGLNVQSQVQSITAFYINAGLPASRMGIGFGIQSGYYWTTQNAVACYNTLENTYPTLRGAFNFSKQGDPNDTFASQVAPSILDGLATTVTVPGSVTGLNATRTTADPTSVDVAWTAPANNGGAAVDGYRLSWVSGGTNWTSPTLVSNPYNITNIPTAAATTITVESHNSAGYGTGVSVVLPATTTATLPLISSLTDDFNGAVNATRVFSSGVVQRNGQIEYDTVDATHRGTWVRADFRAGSAFYLMEPITTANTVTCLFVRSTGSPTTQQMRIAYLNGVINSRFDNGTGDSTPGSQTYNSATMKYWRVIDLGTTIGLQYSPDGSTWTAFARSGFAEPAWLADVQVGVEVYTGTTV